MTPTIRNGILKKNEKPEWCKLKDSKKMKLGNKMHYGVIYK